MLDWPEEVLERLTDRVFAFDEFGPLGISLTGGAGWATAVTPSFIGAHFGRLRQFAIVNSNHRDHTGSPGSCTPACPGATRMPVTLAWWQPSAASAVASAARGHLLGGRALAGAA